MTDQDDTADTTAAQATDDEPSAAELRNEDTAQESDTADDSDGSAGQKVVAALQWGAFAILILVALIATLRFYFAASNAINEFVTRQYRPLFQAVFNLVILLASVLGLSVLARRIA